MRRLLRKCSGCTCVALLLLSCFLLCPDETFARESIPGFIIQGQSHHPFTRSLIHSRFQRHVSARAAGASSNALDSSRIPERLVQSLDLAPVIRALSKHAGTRRGREAILGLVGEEQNAERPAIIISESTEHYMSSKRQRVTRETQARTQRGTELSIARQSLVPIAMSAEEARKEYELVEQATLALEENYGLTVPPLYGATSSPWDTDTIADTDHDEWLTLSFEDWTLEHVLQADQVIQTLLRVREWGGLSETQTWILSLSEIAQTIPRKELLPVHQEIQGAVEIVTKRSFVSSQAMVRNVFGRDCALCDFFDC